MYKGSFDEKTSFVSYLSFWVWRTLKLQVVIAPLLNALRPMCMSQVLGMDHEKGMSHVTVGVAHLIPSLLNGNECRVQVKICSISPAKVTSPYK